MVSATRQEARGAATPATGSASQQTIIAARATAGLRRTTRSAAGSGLPRATSADQAEPFRAAELAELLLVEHAGPPLVDPESALPWDRQRLRRSSRQSLRGGLPDLIDSLWAAGRSFECLGDEQLAGL